MLEKNSRYFNNYKKILLNLSFFLSFILILYLYKYMHYHRYENCIVLGWACLLESITFDFVNLFVFVCRNCKWLFTSRKDHIQISLYCISKAKHLTRGRLHSSLKLVIILIFRIGLVESKVRLLVSQLENKPYIELAHVNPKHYPPLNPEKDCCISRWFIGLTFEKTGKSLTATLILDF